MQQRDAYFTCHQSLDVNSGLGWQPLLELKANSVFLAGHISVLAKLKCLWSYEHAVLLVKKTKRISAEQHPLQGRNHLFTVEKIFLYVHTHESLSIKTLLSKITTSAPEKILDRLQTISELSRIATGNQTDELLNFSRGIWISLVQLEVFQTLREFTVNNCWTYQP